MRAQLSADASERRALLREAEDGLRRALAMDASDPRTYVVLGKLLVRQKRYDEARRLYADGTRNTGNANAFIWSAWGLLESRTGNVARARKLFDAAIVVDEAHAAAWHKWGMLEMRQGNYLRARCGFCVFCCCWFLLVLCCFVFCLLVLFCGGGAFVFVARRRQTLALTKIDAH
jgi:tetratricopeptide (TPR) repeat protein